MIDGVLIFLCSYMICKLSKNKIVNFAFGSLMGFCVLALLTPVFLVIDPYLDLHPIFARFFALGYFGLIFLTGYAIAKATT